MKRMRIFSFRVPHRLFLVELIRFELMTPCLQIANQSFYAVLPDALKC